MDLETQLRTAKWMCRVGTAFQGAVYARNQHLIYHAISPIARIQKSRNQGVEIKVTSLTLTATRNPLAKFLFPVLSLVSAGLGRDIPLDVPTRHNKDSIELEVETDG